MLLFYTLVSFMALATATVQAFAPPVAPFISSIQEARARYPSALKSSNVDYPTSFSPLFDFGDPESVEKFDRIDDVIMGGISSSTIRYVPNATYSKWFGNCRTDGGGFCGIRTLPFVEPLDVADADGFYIKCRLASDDEPERRVWKMSTRIRPDRGEQVYQARFNLTNGSEGADGWSTSRVPFDSFRLVRGPRTVPNAPPLNVTGGVYQFGMTLSKFDFGINVTELENFRDGFFELQMQEVGVYGKSSNVQSSATSAVSVDQPVVLSKKEANRQRPILLKVLLPFGKLFFNEKSQRRKSALRILREERKLSRARSLLFGFRNKRKSSGLVVAVAKTLAILFSDAMRGLVFTSLKLVLVYPLRLLRYIVRLPKKLARAN